MVIDDKILQDKEIQNAINDMVRNLGVDQTQANAAARSAAVTEESLKLDLVKNTNPLAGRVEELDNSTPQELTNKPSPEQIAEAEANARRANMTDNQRAADSDKDGNLTAAENQRAQELDQQQAEFEKNMIKPIIALGAEAVAPGMAVAMMSENEQPGNNLTPSSGLSSILNITQIT